MDKREFLHWLKDPEVQTAIKEITQKEKGIPPIDRAKVEKLSTWWEKASGQKPVLTHFNRLDIIKAINSKGVATVKQVLKKAIDSPLNESGNYMSAYLANLAWCVKEANFVKIANGNYDSKSSTVSAFKDTDTEELNGLEA